MRVENTSVVGKKYYWFIDEDALDLLDYNINNKGQGWIPEGQQVLQ